MVQEMVIQLCSISITCIYTVYCGSQQNRHRQTERQTDRQTDREREQSASTDVWFSHSEAGANCSIEQWLQPVTLLFLAAIPRQYLHVTRVWRSTVEHLHRQRQSCNFIYQTSYVFIVFSLPLLYFNWHCFFSIVLHIAMVIYYKWFVHEINWLDTNIHACIIHTGRLSTLYNHLMMQSSYSKVLTRNHESFMAAVRFPRQTEPSWFPRQPQWSIVWYGIVEFNVPLDTV